MHFGPQRGRPRRRDGVICSAGGVQVLCLFFERVRAQRVSPFACVARLAHASLEHFVLALHTFVAL